MNEELFMGFITNILNTHVWSISSDESSLLQFEQECCFEKTLQPMYTKDYLEYLMENTQPFFFYEITDYLNTNVLLFEFEHKHYLLGPYVKTKFASSAIQELLATHKLPASILMSLKLYYNQFPQLSYSMIHGTLLATMRTFFPNTPEYTYRKLSGFHEELKPQKIVAESTKTYTNIIDQYEMENFFLRKIIDGDVSGVHIAFEHIASSFYASTSPTQHTLYSTDWSGFAVLRTLARKAAELGGASVVRIDEITRESIKRFTNAKNGGDLVDVQSKMIIELTQAVADAKKRTGYTPVIRGLLSYLDTNYTSDCSLSFLAEQAKISEEHLSRQFKKEVGTTLGSYIADMRTKKAAELLKTTQLSISEISMYVGYSDSNYFVKVFKKRYGMTPSAYRLSS